MFTIGLFKLKAIEEKILLFEYTGNTRISF